MKVSKNLYLNPVTNENVVLAPEGEVVESVDAAQMVTVDYKDVHHFDETGTPVFKKRLKERTILTKRSNADKILFGIVFVIFLIQCISLFVPMGWMFMSSLEECDAYLLKDNKFTFPTAIEFENYLEAFTNLELDNGDNYLTMLFNSLWFTFTGAAMHIFMPIMTAYVLSRYRFPGRNFIYTVAVASMMIPIVGTTGAAMKFFADIGIYNTLLFPIVASFGAGFSSCFLVFYGFFKSVSEAYSEAARIDGAGHFRVFFSIILPQALPIIFTYAVTFSIDRWNDYMSLLIYMPDYKTLAAGLYEYSSIIEHGTGDYPVYFAGLIISAIPPVILFCLVSKKIMTSLSVGGLKG